MISLVFKMSFYLVVLRGPHSQSLKLIPRITHNVIILSTESVFWVRIAMDIEELILVVTIPIVSVFNHKISSMKCLKCKQLCPYCRKL
jgi:hypothetical protein